jgi:peptide/nickel transport system permease protein
VLAVVSYTIEMMIAIPLGIYSALRQYSKFDQAFTFFSYAAFSMPTFWLGLILIYVFAVQWPVLPAGRVGGKRSLRIQRSFLAT